MSETCMDENTYWLTLWTRVAIAVVVFAVTLNASCAAENAYRNKLIVESDDPLSTACATELVGRASSTFACQLAGRKQ